jgi:hypothetical protein
MGYTIVLSRDGLPFAALQRILPRQDVHRFRDELASLASE